jgi:hypothetical protein
LFEPTGLDEILHALLKLRRWFAHREEVELDDACWCGRGLRLNELVNLNGYAGKFVPANATEHTVEVFFQLGEVVDGGLKVTDFELQRRALAQ